MSEVLSEVLAQKEYNKVSTIVSFMEEHGEITPKEAEAVTGKSAATVRRYFKILTGTRYIVAENREDEDTLWQLSAIMCKLRQWTNSL